jgi:predicted  nucleic acid-binding Zn-ribbon protein
MYRNKIVLLIAALSLLIPAVTGCSAPEDFDSQVEKLTAPYRFHIFNWEVKTLAGEFARVFTGQPEISDNGTEIVVKFFANAGRIKQLESEILQIGDGKRTGDLAALEDELSKLKEENAGLAGKAERVVESQIRAEYSRQGIFNPGYKYSGIKVGFPPMNIILAGPPHNLIISPRDKIETLKTMVLLPEMTREEKGELETGIDELGVSSLVEGLGGIATYPSYVTDDSGIRFALDTAAEEWLHQYLAFTPLGFRYVLDLTGIRKNYDIVTINETVASMVSKEIGGTIYRENYARYEKPAEQAKTETGFDFNRTMREIRMAVDDMLARGEIEQAEQYMEQQRQYLEDNGHFIRRLNQAYFAFHGSYADSPTSVSPIGVELNDLRAQSATLKEFLDTVMRLKSRQGLADLAAEKD